MATYVNDLRLKEITTGDESGTWGTSTNTNLELIGEAVSYATQESFSSDADVTTTVADGAADPARAFYFKVTSSGSLSATRVLTIAPNTMSRIQIIENATSGSQIITISQGSGANVNIPNGETRMVYMDGAGSGAAVVDALADINIGGKLTVGVDDTGYDVTLFGATSGQKVFWDESADTLYQTCTVDIDGTVTVGVDDTGYDVKFFGATSGNYMLWDESADKLILYGQMDVGVNDTGYDVNFFGATSGQKVFWDESADTLYQTCTVDIDGTVTVGVDDTGYDVKFFGATSGAYMLWDESADDLKLVGAAGFTVAGDIDIDGTANLDVVDIDGATQADGTITVGADDTGYDVKFFGATASAYMLWDESADDLILAGAARVVVPASGLVIGSTAVSSTAAELNLLDGLDRGSILYGNASSATTVLGQGSADQVLTSDGTDISWEDASGGGVSLTGSTNNTITTVTGADAIQGEADLTFDGTILQLGTGTSSCNFNVYHHAAGQIASFSNQYTQANMTIYADDTQMQLRSYIGLQLSAGHGDQANKDFISFFTNNGASERMRIIENGNVGIGTATPDVELDVDGEIRAADGILFGTDTAAANALDDYEEGTWTPAITTGSGSITVDDTGTEAVYTKVGNLVTWTTRIDLTSVSSPSGAVNITGLPYTSHNPSGDMNTCQAGQFLELTASAVGGDIIGLVPDATTYCNIRRSGTTGNGNDLGTYIDGGTYLLLSGTYFAA